MTFRSAQIVLFVRDIDRMSAFYASLGFTEAFRTPATGTPIHVDLVLDGYRIGLATAASTRDDHGLGVVDDGPRAAVILWTDDVDAAFREVQAAGGAPVREPYRWLDRLRIAWLADPEGHLVQVVQAIT